MAKPKGPLPVKAGVALGILWGAACVLLAIAANFGYATGWVNLLAEVYIGYSACATGVILGAVYGFVDGFILAFVFTWLYDKLNIKK